MREVGRKESRKRRKGRRKKKKRRKGRRKRKESRKAWRKDEENGQESQRKWKRKEGYSGMDWSTLAHLLYKVTTYIKCAFRNFKGSVAGLY